MKGTAPRPDGGTDFDGNCSCPVGLDCKHVAAALFAARRERGDVPRPAPPPAPAAAPAPSRYCRPRSPTGCASSPRSTRRTRRPTPRTSGSVSFTSSRRLSGRWGHLAERCGLLGHPAKGWQLRGRQGRPGAGGDGALPAPLRPGDPAADRPAALRARGGCSGIRTRPICCTGSSSPAGAAGPRWTGPRCGKAPRGRAASPDGWRRMGASAPCWNWTEGLLGLALPAPWYADPPSGELGVVDLGVPAACRGTAAARAAHPGRGGALVAAELGRRLAAPAMALPDTLDPPETLSGPPVAAASCSPPGRAASLMPCAAYDHGFAKAGSVLRQGTWRWRAC